jgi:hypothetical protein
MELVMIFFWMMVIAAGVAGCSGLWGWWNTHTTNWNTAENAFRTMIDAAMTAEIFGLLALMGLLFV